MTISVVIPTVGRPKCLVNTVRLLQIQTVQPDEIIIVDQTPEFDTEDRILVDDLKRISNVVYLRQDEPNASRARNAGLRRSSGDIVLFLDDDVSFMETLIERHLENYGCASIPGVAGQVRTQGRVASKRNILSRLPGAGWLVFPFDYDSRCKVESARGANLSVRRDLAIAAGGMDERYERGGFREEADFCARFVRRFGPLTFDPSAWVDTLAWPVGGIRKTSQKYHLECEFYFIFKNVRALFRPAHLAYAVYRQWYLRRSVRGFVRETIPFICASAVIGWKRAKEQPRYFRDSEMAFGLNGEKVVL